MTERQIIKIWRTTEGDCRCPGPYNPGEEPTCRHQWQCQWGMLNNTEADPRYGLQHLMLITAETVGRLLTCGPEPSTRGTGTVSATRDGERLFVHYDIDGNRTTWELFDAAIIDRGGGTVVKSPNLMIGKWPD